MNRSFCQAWMPRREAGKPDGQRAFSLLELSVVIIIIGVIAGVALGLKQSGADDCVSITKTQIKDIQGAMERFVIQNERYPLPAVRTAGVEDVKYGREVTSAELLANPGLLDATTPPTTTPPTSSVTFGALPFQALGLAPSYAGDCWGNKFSYAVTTDLTETGKFNQQLPLQTYEGVITVKADASAAPVSVKAAYVVISHGANGLGAVKVNYHSDTNDKRYCALGSTLDSENCEPSNAVFVGAAYNDGKDAGTKFFDDIIVFSDKKQRSVSGVCNNVLPNSCMVGSAVSDNGLTACGTTRTWTCSGSGGGNDATCAFANPVCATCSAEPTITALWNLFGSTSDSYLYPAGKNALPRNNCPAGYTPTALIDDNDAQRSLSEDKSSGSDRAQLCLGTSDTNVQFISVWASVCPAGTIDTGVYDSDCNDLGEHKLYEEQPQGCRQRWCLGIAGTGSPELDLKVQHANSATCPAGWTWLVSAHNNEWDVNNEDGTINRAVCIKLDYKPTSTCAAAPTPPTPPTCTADGQPSGGNPASCCSGDSDGDGTCGNQGSICTCTGAFLGYYADDASCASVGGACWGLPGSPHSSIGCYSGPADCSAPTCTAFTLSTLPTPAQVNACTSSGGSYTSYVGPVGMLYLCSCPGGPPPCTADGQPSGGNPASCCNGDSDGNGTCGTQAAANDCSANAGYYDQWLNFTCNGCDYVGPDVVTSYHNCDIPPCGPPPTPGNPGDAEAAIISVLVSNGQNPANYNVCVASGSGSCPAPGCDAWFINGIEKGYAIHK